MCVFFFVFAFFYTNVHSLLVFTSFNYLISDEIKKKYWQCILARYTKTYSIFLKLPSLTVAIFVLLVKELYPFNTDLKHDLSNDNSPNGLN